MQYKNCAERKEKVILAKDNDSAIFSFYGVGKERKKTKNHSMVK